MAKNKDKKSKRINFSEAPDEKALSKRDLFIYRAKELASKTKGDTRVMFMDGSETVEDIPVVPTGIPSLDIALGVGGIPRGRIIEIIGPEMSGKTTLAIYIIEEAVKLGGTALFIDAEHSLDVGRLRALNLLEHVAIVQPDSGEEGLEVLESMIDVSDIIVVDSVAALVPQAEIDGEMGDSHMGLQARLMSQAMRKITGKIAKSECTVIFINQIRCLPIDTIVVESGKLTTIGNLVKGDKVLSHHGETTTVTETVTSGRVAGKKLTIKHKGTFSISDNHLQPVIRGDKIVEVYGKDIVSGDFIITPEPLINTISDDIDYIDISPIINNITIATNAKNREINTRILDETLSFMLGMYYSDGSMIEHTKSSTYAIRFTENNNERWNLVTSTATILFGEENITYSGMYPTISLNGVYYTELFKALGCNKYGKNKTIPDLILRSKRSVIISFIRGMFFDTHGFNENGFIFTNENPDETEKIATVLHHLGVSADIRKDRSDWYNRLYITGSDAVRFTKVIGFAEDTKQKLSLSFKDSIGARGKYDVVPGEFGAKYFYKALSLSKSRVFLSYHEQYYPIYMCIRDSHNISRERLIEFLQNAESTELDEVINMISNYRYYEITKVEDTEFEAIDISVDAPDSLFIADKFLTHNSKIGVMFGSPETTTGGNALKFYASIRIDLRSVETYKDGEVSYGNKVKAFIKKNKVAPPFVTCYFDMYYDITKTKDASIFSFAEENGIVMKSGTWYSYKDERLGQGRANSIDTFLSNEVFKKEITEEALQKIDAIIEAKKKKPEYIDQPEEEQQKLEVPEEKPAEDIPKEEVNEEVDDSSSPSL